MEDFDERYLQARKLINELKNAQARKDLLRMGKALDEMRRNLSIETVACHRINRETRKYLELQVQCEQQLENIEKHLMLAKMKYG